MNRLFVLLLTIFISISLVKSQELTVNAEADIVSSYIWRGLYVGPASVQPGISLSSEVLHWVSGALPASMLHGESLTSCQLFNR